MMLSDQERAIRQWVFDALAHAAKPIPLEHIVWSNQSGGLPRPHVLLIPTGGTRRGPAPGQRAEGDHGASTLHTRTDGTGSVSITVVGVVARESLDDAARAYTAELLPRLQMADIDQPLRDANLAVSAVTDLPSLDRITGDSQWATRAALDVTFTTAIVVTSQPGTVQEVEVTGTTEPPSDLGTWTIP